jgi:hypothetical protein
MCCLGQNVSPLRPVVNSKLRSNCPRLPVILSVLYYMPSVEEYDLLPAFLILCRPPGSLFHILVFSVGAKHHVFRLYTLVSPALGFTCVVCPFSRDQRALTAYQTLFRY